MKKHILIYGLCGGVLIVVLKLVEYRFLVVEHSVEIYGGLIALLFAALGIWLGLKLTKNKETIVVREVPSPQPFTLNETRLCELGITRRELDILELIAGGLSKLNSNVRELRFIIQPRVHSVRREMFIDWSVNPGPTPFGGAEWLREWLSSS